MQTPEYVEIEYELAGLGSRAVACLVDSVVQAAVIIVCVLGGLYLSSLLTRGNPLELVSVVVASGGGLLGFVGYWVAVEMFTGGQSLGKRMAGLRVIRDDGTPLSFWDSVIRNLLRLIDMLPANYLVGIVSLWVSGQSKRLGDYAAGTVVVKERVAEMPTDAVVPHDEEQVAADVMPVSDDLRLRIRLLSDDDAVTASRFLERRDDLAGQVRAELAERLAGAIASRLGLDSAAYPDPEQFLSEVVVSHRRWRRSSG